MQAFGSNAMVEMYVRVGVQTVVGEGGEGGGGVGGVGRNASTPEVQFSFGRVSYWPLLSQHLGVPLCGPAGW